ncbi:glycosyltransferase [Streptococcus parauberis]|uniref:Glycosyltransferase, group 1 family protein n=1 Tax=Streptococcus parauberis NCFD 2020 TaxID=873447 RepID=F1Z116_9STRE|nr:glycosyltransferase [Streptococcus parauberis]EGE54561.1 glycosyltransferase, group 1 family protein [Streptococcus parauberis NCFD 2020]
MSKVKILHCPIGSMNIGGIENMIMQMYRHIDRDKFEFDFLVHDENKNFYEDEINSFGGKLYRIDFISKHPIKHVVNFIKFFKKHPEYQIIHIHTTYSIMFVDAMIAKLFDRKVIIHSHNSSAPGKRKIIHKLFKNIQNYFSDYRVSCSDYASEWMFPKRVQNEVVFWPNALDITCLKFDSKLRDTLRTDYQVGDKFIIGNIGRFSYQKNQTKLIDVFTYYNKYNSNSELWLIGDGPDKVKLKSYVEELGISDYVKFMGPTDNVVAYLSALDFFIMTSHYEGLPLSLIEAQATGLNTITLSDGITKLVKVAPYLKYLENNATNNEWKNAIEAGKSNQFNRDKAFELIQKSQFNIENWIIEVEKIYTIISKGGKINVN